MDGIRLTGALTLWKAPHPAWRSNPEWPEEVGFATWESTDVYVFIDPLVRDDLDAAAWERFDLAVAESDRPAAVLLTAPWHERSVRAVAARYDAHVWIHPRGRARVADLPELEALPEGVEVFVPDGVDEGQVAFHIVPEQALVVAEFFLGTNSGLQVLPSPGTQDRAAFAASLDQLRNLSIERVLVAHGPAVLQRGEDAIRAALDAFATRDAG
jgi:glyoxylase-like metal-dependent hydrolase (beta-lactamase superfamily II)